MSPVEHGTTYTAPARWRARQSVVWAATADSTRPWVMKSEPRTRAKMNTQAAVNRPRTRIEREDVKTSTAAETQHQRPASDQGSGCRAGQAATAQIHTRAISTGGGGPQRIDFGARPDAMSLKSSCVAILRNCGGIDSQEECVSSGCFVDSIQSCAYEVSPDGPVSVGTCGMHGTGRGAELGELTPLQIRQRLASGGRRLRGATSLSRRGSAARPAAALSSQLQERLSS